METRNVTVTLEKAKEWYNSGNRSLKEVALQAFSEKELEAVHFSQITCFKDVCLALRLDYSREVAMCKEINIKSKAASASYRLNLIRRALNLGQKMSLVEGEVWYPYTPFLAKKNSYSKDSGEVRVAKFRYDGDTYTLLGGYATIGSSAGLGYFFSRDGVALSRALVGFLGCATKEIAQHFGRYFGKDIFEAKYGDLIDFHWV